MRHRLAVTVTLAALSSLASAESKTSPTTVALIDQQLIQPLAVKDRDRSRFSRARLPPSERRARVESKSKQDSSGESFYAFAIDVRQGWGEGSDEDNWSKAAITGCAYPKSGHVFIKRGDSFHPATAAVGKKTKAAPDGTCQATARVSAR